MKALTAFDCLRLLQAFLNVVSLFAMEDADSAKVEETSRQVSRSEK